MVKNPSSIVVFEIDHAIIIKHCVLNDIHIYGSLPEIRHYWFVFVKLLYVHGVPYIMSNQLA